MTQLHDRIALVTGGSRGVGRGVACALGDAGATVYVTGRASGQSPDASWLPGSIEETAAEVTRRGGRGVALTCDHRDDAQVSGVVDRIREEHGRLDLLVNNVFSCPDEVLDPGPFWEKPLTLWQMVDVGLRSHYVATCLAAPLMVEAGRGLVVCTSSYGAVAHVHGPVYGAGKAGLDKLVYDMAVDLQPHGVACISLWLGLIGTERTLSVETRYPGMFDLSRACSPEFPGRVIAALAADPEVIGHSGHTLIDAEIGAAYGVVDVDGSAPRSLRRGLGSPVLPPAGA